MAAEIFSVEVDTTQAQAELNSFTAFAIDWSRGIESSTGFVQKSFEQMFDSDSDYVRSIKERINSIIEQINYIESLPSQHQAAYVEHYKSLTGELVRKKEELAIALESESQAQQDVNEGTERGSESIGGYGKAILSVTAIIAAAKVIYEAFKAIMTSTAEGARQWEVSMAGASASLKEFFRSIALGDWSNLVKNMQDAAEAAREYTREMQYIDALKRQYSRAEMELDAQIRRQREIISNLDKRDIEGRIEGEKRLMTLLQMKADVQLDVAKKIFDAESVLTGQLSGLSQEQIRFAADHSAEMLELADSFKKAEVEGITFTEAMTRGAGGLFTWVEQTIAGSRATDQMKESIREYIRNAADPQAETLVRIALAYGTLSTEQQKNLEIALDNYNQTKINNELEIASSSDRINAILKERDVMLGKITLEDRLKQAIEDYIKAYERRDEVTMANAQRDIIALQTEIANRKVIVDLIGKEAKFIEEMARFEGLDVMNNNLIKIRDSHGRIVDFQKEYNKALETGIQHTHIITKNIEAEEEARNKILGGVRDYANVLAEALGYTKEEVFVLNGVLDIISTIVNEMTEIDTLTTQGKFQIALTMLTMLAEVLPNAAEKFEQEMTLLTEAADRAKWHLDTFAERMGTTNEELREYIDILEQQRRLAWEEWIRLASQGRIKAAEEYRVMWMDLTQDLEEANQELIDRLRGGITEIDIADVIAMAFEEGKTSVDDFALYMEDVFREALMNLFKEKILLAIAESGLMDYITEALADSVLDPAEINEINRRVATLAVGLEPLWNSLFGGLEAISSGLAALISGAQNIAQSETQTSEAVTESAEAVTASAGALTTAAEASVAVSESTRVIAGVVDAALNVSEQSLLIINQSRETLVQNAEAIASMGEIFARNTGMLGEIGVAVGEEVERTNQLNAVLNRMSQASDEEIDYSRLSLDRLVNIEANTYNTVEGIRVMVTQLNQVITGLGAVYSYGHGL